MKVLVTGAAGFIGSHIVDALVHHGCDVVGVDCLLPAAHTTAPDYLNPAAEWHEADLRDGTSLGRILAGIDGVSHQAAMVGLGQSFDDVTDYVIHNDLATGVLLKALSAKGFEGRFVLGGSMVVYGEGSYECVEHGPVRPPPRSSAKLDAGHFESSCPQCGRDLDPRPISETIPADPRNVYAATKLHQEHLASIFSRETGAPVTLLRYHNVYGPRMPQNSPYAGVASIFRSRLEQGRPPEVFEDGRQLRDFIHVTDVARANVLALTSTIEDQGPFNIATGQTKSIMDMATSLAEAGDGPALSPVVTGRYRLGDVRHVFASTERAQQVLGFRAEVGFAEGMRNFSQAWLRGSGRPAEPRSSRAPWGNSQTRATRTPPS
ncbi:MAG: NAD-dependent epimerase/dehydratase family protein [Actinomycetota bacterium]|nr:NAD-dependent epimerase/dehydratase family protein [Actinomycetota bacterium]